MNILFSNPKFINKKYKYVFIVSHMRSYSTVLSHILGSNPEISGYLEMHQGYKNYIDFMKLKIKIGLYVDKKIKGPFLLDKILHNRYTLSPEILKRKNVRVIFMLRNPKDTIHSILGLGTKGRENEWYGTPKKVFEYYYNRIKAIKSFASKYQGEALFIDSELFKKDPNTVLKLLTSWLRLSYPLSNNYQIFKYTGIPGYGDSSLNIMKGKFDVRVKKSIYIKHILETEKIKKKECEYEYYKCKDFLEEHFMFKY